MKSKEYLINSLKELSDLFSEIQIRYEYREITKSHIVEIIPLCFFDDNEPYIKHEIFLEQEFEKKFPDENIIFVSESSLTEINDSDTILVFDENRFAFESESIIIAFEINDFNQNIENNNYAIAA